MDFAWIRFGNYELIRARVDGKNAHGKKSDNCL